MLLASPGLEDLYEKTCNFVETGSREREELVHPTRALKFLVGLKEKREMMALGGPWSPSLDGAGPGTDPSTLIRYCCSFSTLLFVFSFHPSLTFRSSIKFTTSFKSSLPSS